MFLRDTDICDRRPIAYWLSYFFRRRTVPRRLNDPPAFIQSSSFGPETPALFAARSPNAIALWAGIACSPCVNAYNNRQSVCRNNLCMQAITVDDVFKEVTGIYDSLKRTTSGN